MSTNAQMIKIETPDGYSIELVVESSDATRRNSPGVILTHGIFTDRDEKGRFIRLSEKLRSQGFDVFRFDFRAHGTGRKTEPKFSITGALIDYLSVLRWVNGHGWTDLSVIGSSFGGSIVLLETMRPSPFRINSTVLLNPVIDYKATFLQPTLQWGKDLFPDRVIESILASGSAIIQDGFDCTIDFLMELSILAPWLALKSMNRPTLILHGDLDDKVPLETAKRYCQDVNNVRLQIITGAGHSFKATRIEHLVHQEIADWIKAQSART